MKKIIVILIVVGLGLYGNQAFKKYRSQQPSDTSEITAEQLSNSPPETIAENLSDPLSKTSASHDQFKCDGRTYCSQMTSCEEATFFLKNCSNVKMDGNNDGIPCEKQWCK